MVVIGLLNVDLITVNVTEIWFGIGLLKGG